MILFGFFVATTCIFALTSLILFRKVVASRAKTAEMEKKLDSYANSDYFLEQECKNIREKLNDKEKYITDIKADYHQRLVEQEERHNKMIKQMENSAKESFANIANVILEQKNQSLQEQSMKNIKHVLEPFKVDLTNFKQLIHTFENQRTQQHASLETQIRNMQNVNQGMISTAENLTKALRGDSKIQGNWGEMVVKKILESAGLVEGQHYTEQGRDLDLKDESGRMQRPDFIINLPNNKHIILDSKVSLTHYERYCTNENDEDLKGFVLSIARHIDDLSKKRYHENHALNAPDFTMMVIPIESAYFLAIHNDPDLYQKAWEKRIALCCPSTLLAMLQTIGHLWEIDMQNKNAQEIARNAVNLAKKFQGFSESLDAIGVSLRKAGESYDVAKKQLLDGHGNLKARVEKIASLAKLGIESDSGDDETKFVS